MDPNDAMTYSNRGIAYRNLGQSEQAIQDHNRAIELNWNDSTIYYNRGVAYLNLPEYQQAIQDFSKVIELDPNNVTAYLGRGLAYKMMGQYMKAIQDFNKVIQLNPGDSIEASLSRASVYERLSEYDCVKKDFDGGNLRIVDMLESDPKVT